MSWVITGTQKIDPDAAVYLSRVEAADGQALEAGVRTAVDQFVLGCKADGTWNAIKASCILAGARTLTGALAPLSGTAPTNVGPFVSGDYNRKTGLMGDGSTKRLDANRNNNADPQNSVHQCIYVTAKATGFTGGLVDAGSTPGPTNLYFFASGSEVGTRNRSTDFDNTSGLSGNWLGFLGQSRSSSSSYIRRVNSANTAVTRTSAAPDSGNHIILNSANARLAFYSIGESLDLALLDARVTTLVNAFAAAIP